MAGGSNANKAGKGFESQIQQLIEQKNISVILYKDRDKCNDDIVLFKDVPYSNMYGRKAVTEFVLKIKERFIRIECKSQHCSGSTSKKAPAMYLNALLYSEDEVILLIKDGSFDEKVIDGLKKGILRQYFSNCIRKEQIIHIFNTEEFQDWLDNEFSVL